MIDSICPHALKHQTQNIVPHSPFTSSRCKPEIGFLISNQLKASAKLVQDWVMPSWSSRPRRTPLTLIGITAIDRLKEEEETMTATSLSSHGSSSSFSSSSGDDSRGSSTTAFAFYSDEDISHRPSSSPKPLIEKTLNNNKDDCNRNSGSPPPPPTILLRCNDYVPVSKSKNRNAISKVDTVRDRRLLGWDEYVPDLVQCVLDVPGHHFSLFAEENVSRFFPPPVHTPERKAVATASGAPSIHKPTLRFRVLHAD